MATLLTLSLQLILVLGNFMNASSLQGGAFGMRISSINKASRRHVVMHAIC